LDLVSIAATTQHKKINRPKSNKAAKEAVISKIFLFILQNKKIKSNLKFLSGY